MRKLILGAGCRRGVGVASLRSALAQFLEKNGVLEEEIVLIASCDLKSEEPGLLALARALSVEIRFFPREELDRVSVPNPSPVVKDKIGIGSVSEAAAILAGCGELITAKHKYGNITFALAV